MFLLTMEKLSAFIERELEKRGWTQADLCRASGMNDSMISNLINERRKLGLNSVISLAKAFNMSTDEVLRGSGLLPPVKPRTAEHERLLHQYDLLKRDQQIHLMNYIDFLLSK